MELTKERILPLLGVTAWKYRLLESHSGPWLHQPAECKCLVAMDVKEWENPWVQRLFESWCNALNFSLETVGVLRRGAPQGELRIDVIFGEGPKETNTRCVHPLSYYIEHPQSKRELWIKTLDLKGPEA